MQWEKLNWHGEGRAGAEGRERKLRICVPQQSHREEQVGFAAPVPLTVLSMPSLLETSS